MAQDHNRGVVALLILRLKPPAMQRRHAQGAEQSGGAQCALDRLRAIPAEVEAADAERADVGEGFCALLQIEDVRCGQRRVVEHGGDLLLQTEASRPGSG